MSHSYVNGNTNGNNYLNKKRLEEDIQMDNRYHYDRYEKFDKNVNHGRYNNMNYSHSKPIQGNMYYNTGPRYRSYYYNNPKSYHGNGYSSKFVPKRDYKKPYQKNSYPNVNEGIRNLSNCEMPSPPSLSLKNRHDADSLKSISSSTAGESKSSLNDSNNGFNIKSINKLISNFTSHITSGREKIIFQDYPPNFKYKEKKNSAYYEERLKCKKEEDDDEDEEMPIFQFPKVPEKLLNYEPFNKNSVKIEENPIENFEMYPNNIFEINMNNFTRKSYSSPKNEPNKNNFRNNLSIKSCYLLAKIPNWRLVTNFVPASQLTSEKFKNIMPIQENSDDEDDDRTEELEPKKNDSKNEEKGDEPKKDEPIKSFLVYSDKFEEIVDKSLEQLDHKRKQVKRDIFNKKYIIAQYHYDILKLKNKIKQNKYKINYLNIKQENTSSVIDDKIKNDFFSVI